MHHNVKVMESKHDWKVGRAMWGSRTTLSELCGAEGCWVAPLTPQHAAVRCFYQLIHFLLTWVGIIGKVGTVDVCIAHCGNCAHRISDLHMQAKVRLEQVSCRTRAEGDSASK
jgi:hypothetical protein